MAFCLLLTNKFFMMPDLVAATFQYFLSTTIKKKWKFMFRDSFGLPKNRIIFGFYGSYICIYERVITSNERMFLSIWTTYWTTNKIAMLAIDMIWWGCSAKFSNHRHLFHRLHEIMFCDLKDFANLQYSFWQYEIVNFGTICELN